MEARQVAWLLVATSFAACGFHVSANAGDGDGGVDAASDGDGVDGPSPLDAPPPGARRRVKMSFQNSGRAINLDEFVVLAALDNTKVEYTAITAGGANLRFTDPDGTPLPYEIDEWRPGGNSFVWVRVPRIDAASDADYIYMHYGDPALADAQDSAAVFTNYRSVWHLSQDPGPGGIGDIKDSTTFHNDGTATAPMASADRVNAIIGKGMSFTGNATGIVATAISLPTYTWQMWIRGAANPTTNSGNLQPLSNGDANFNFAWDHVNPLFAGAAAQRDVASWKSVAPNTALVGGTWYLIAGTYDGTQLCISRDGNLLHCTAAGSPLPPSSSLFQIGLASSNASSFVGLVDEVRVSSIATTSLRLDAEHANQRASAGNPFVIYAAPEDDP